ncbi:MAG TPA: DegQ family serine endoprotease [Pseudomonadales bacterium]
MKAEAVVSRAAWLLVLVSACLGAQAAELPDFTRLVEQNAPAVVNISTSQNPERERRSRNEELEEFFRRFFPPGEMPRIDPGPRPRSLGSGFVIGSDGYILTNNHVVEGADEIVVRFNDRRELLAELVGSDPRSDLALIKVDAEDLPTVKLGDSNSLRVGEWVLAIGSPFGFDYSVTAGIVSAKGRSLPDERNENYVPFIQTDVAINPGNSGGPLFNLKGEVIGINSQIYSNSGGFMGVSFAIPIDVAMEVVDQLKNTGRVTRGWLGVFIQEVNRDLAESFGLDRPHGALVTQVLQGSPAEEAGLQAGDIITRFNGTAIDFSADLPHLVGRVPAGSRAKVDVVRGGEERTLTVEIGELPERDAALGYVAPAGDRDSRLGLRVEPLPPDAASALGIAGGVRVVEASGIAADAGIRKGDVIVRLDNKAVSDPETFREIVEGLEAGRSVPVLINRGRVSNFLALRVPE